MALRFQVLIGKLTVPAALFVDLTPCMKRSHSGYHYVGAIVLLGGVAVSLASDWSGVSTDNNSGEVLLNLSLLIIAILPAALGVALAGTFLERSPKTSNMYFWSWVVVTEVLMLPPLAFLNAWVQGLPFSEIWPNLVGGTVCLATGKGYGASKDPDIDCSKALIWFWASYPCCLAFNLCIPAIARRKELGAPVVYMLRAVALPLSVFFFSFRFLMGDNTTPIGWPVGVALLLVMAALCIYYWEDFYPWIRSSWLCRPRRRGQDRWPSAVTIASDDEREYVMGPAGPQIRDRHMGRVDQETEPDLRHSSVSGM